MEGCSKVRQGKRLLIIYSACALFVYLLGAGMIWADDALNVRKDGDKTVYTVGATDEKDNALGGKNDEEKAMHSIGPSNTKRDEKTKDKERSWDMLKNMGIAIDDRQSKHHNIKNSQNQTNQDKQNKQAPMK